LNIFHVPNLDAKRISQTKFSILKEKLSIIFSLMHGNDLELIIVAFSWGQSNLLSTCNKTDVRLYFKIQILFDLIGNLYCSVSLFFHLTIYLHELVLNAGKLRNSLIIDYNQLLSVFVLNSNLTKSLFESSGQVRQKNVCFLFWTKHHFLATDVEIPVRRYLFVTVVIEMTIVDTLKYIFRNF